MADGAPKAPYADLPPRDITDTDLHFLSDYTGERDLAALRQHVLDVWHAVKAKARCLCCVGFSRSAVCNEVPPGTFCPALEHFVCVKRKGFIWQLSSGLLLSQAQVA